MRDREIFGNINTVYKRISRAALSVDRTPFDITLIAVTKTVEPARILEAVDAGVRIFGENRVQEAQMKVSSRELSAIREPVRWHLIGRLQRNKAKAAVRLFDLIHSIDSLELAFEVDRHAGEAGKIQDVLVEVKLSPEETKHGVRPEGLLPLLEAVCSLRHLRLRGLMTIPPYSEDPEDARPFFRSLRELRNTAGKEGFDLPDLSMGMSHDLEVAIEEGATLVRVGTAIFGGRP